MDFYYLHHYIQKGFSPEYLLNDVDALTKRFFIVSMEQAIEEDNKRRGVK